VGQSVLLKKAAIIILAACSIGGSARAGTNPARRAGKRTAGSDMAPLGDREQFRQDFVNSMKDYQASLQALARAYSDELNALTARNATLKDLFSRGIISRVEMEQSDAKVAEARAKIDSLGKDAKSADAALAAALDPRIAGPDSAASGAGALSSSTNWTTGDSKIDGLIRRYGGRYSVDPYLVYLVMRQESSFNSSAASPKGAEGLMQLMPGTAARYGVRNRLDPAQSIMGGAHYLSDLLQLFNGNVSLALAGYNAGEGAVMKYGNRVPPYKETKYYVQNISSRYKARTKR
jgi:soluble lytic murein transglycosylase-like protein